MKHEGVTLDLVDAVFDKLGGIFGAERLLRGELQIVLFKPDILTINYSLTLEEMIALGRYDWCNHEITSKRFPIVGDGIQEINFHLINFGRSITTEEARRELARQDLMPAKIEHLLAFAAKFPDEQKQFPIISLNSFSLIRGGCRYVSLGYTGNQRELNLDLDDDCWRDYYRFLVIS
ncbi:hypothetical protein IT409_01635 [Candidatus Falkowbacteria bacterium]|nr:hypothetical protein [Candidatus Falkowbacteria bacterium]